MKINIKKTFGTSHYLVTFLTAVVSVRSVNYTKHSNFNTKLRHGVHIEALLAPITTVSFISMDNDYKLLKNLNLVYGLYSCHLTTLVGPLIISKILFSTQINDMEFKFTN